MVESVEIGITTETQFVTRWGRPVQKVREGAQVDYIYRDIVDVPFGDPISHGDSTRFVIVTFQYGRAVAVRTSDEELCRATFAPRPPGHAFDNPTTVYPIWSCPGLFRPSINSRTNTLSSEGAQVAGSHPIVNADEFPAGAAK